MAHFLAEIEAGGSPVTRTGNKSTGIVARINGWNVGAEVVVSHENGKDVVRIYRTTGSGGGRVPSPELEFNE